MKAEYKVSRELWSSRISKKIPSNFIEMGYGLQVECMSAEMFFNRSFEPFYPYREINKHWFDLHINENDPEAGYETDWSIFDWYHSGYEHNAWFAFPGTGGKMAITDESTFVIGKAPGYDVTIAYDECDYHGKYGMKVVNNSEIRGGLAQDGKYCHKGVSYIFRGAMKNICGADQVNIEIYHEGEVSDPVVSIPVTGVTDKLSEKSVSFTVAKEGRYTFAVVIPPHSQLLCDDFSLMPEDHIGGWKKSTIEVSKYVAPAVVRWPGGCFASFYDWHDGIGNDRKPDYSYFWGGYNYNDVGTDEFGKYINAIGAEGMICINMHHPYKKYYEMVLEGSKGMDPENPDLPHTYKHNRNMDKFSNLERGAKEAADWVEYCNGDENTVWGAKRAANGQKKPYYIKYWEMDNESFRWFDELEYAKACTVYTKEMKKVDPAIRIGMDCYSYPVNVLANMLEIAGNDIDFLADRGVAESELHAKVSILKAYNEQNGTNIKYCNTEWLPLNGADKMNMVQRQGDVAKSYLFSKWSYALEAAKMLLMWQRYGDVIDFINFNNMANTHAQSAIETTKEGAYVTAAGEMLHMFAHTKAAYTLKCEDYLPGRTDDVHVQAAYTDEKDALVINILNFRTKNEEIRIDISEFVQTGRADGVVLYADSLVSMNTLQKREIRKKSAEAYVSDGMFKVCADKLSFSEYVVKI